MMRGILRKTERERPSLCKRSLFEQRHARKRLESSRVHQDASGFLATPLASSRASTSAALKMCATG